ncbi:ParB family protein [Vibrio mediterranei]|uniref:Chromosome partitioning protein ParB n=1 Tax=Vibrio mediterranei TaxID=689 RepID=A0ABX5DA80_9VIBR|nr:ParB family protein [Vibrio mediterranei]PCD85930.1 chromosome partitioning protein ParB [Vibrio mediterranei]PRQ65375.1 chromosome partitioning protein ParB [Vibrio mediterranei]
MAKKKQILGITGDQENVEEAKLTIAKSNLESLPDKLKQDLEATGGNLQSYLRDTFGVTTETKEVVWKLASGAKATFLEVGLTYEQVKNETLVEFDINGRDQQYLTAENLSDLSTMDYQQFYPAITIRKDGKISFLDGSRRRAYFLLQEGRISHFTVLVSDDDISSADAKALAKSIQTAKEHNLYELGKRLLPMKEGGMTQLEIAKSFSISQSRVSKAIKAATINQELYALFADINELSGANYAELAKIDTHILKREDKYLCTLGIEKGDVDSVMVQLRKLIKGDAPEIEKSITVPLVTFDDKNKFAKKTHNKAARRITYDFQRLTAEQQSRIDTAISNVMNEMFGDK